MLLDGFAQHFYPLLLKLLVSGSFVFVRIPKQSHAKLQMKGEGSKTRTRTLMSLLQWDKTIKLPLWRSSEPKNSEFFVKHNQQLSIDINSEAGTVYREENNFCSSG